MTNCLSDSTGKRNSRQAKHILTTLGVSLLVLGHGGVGLAENAAPKGGTEKKAADKASDKSKPAEKAEAKRPEPVIENVQNVTPEQVVEHPHDFLNKNIKFTAAFHSFTNVGLDYKPALRPAKTNLSFFVLRKDSHVPLSELKLDMPIPKEKDPENQMLAQLKDGDTVEITGHVFSTALDDPWVDVLRLKKIASAPDDKKTKEEKEKEKESTKKEKEGVEQKPESTPDQKPNGPKDGTKLELKIDKDKAAPDKKPDSSDKK
jgi:hypothetical protein